MSGILMAAGSGGIPGAINSSAGAYSAASSGGASLNVNNDGTLTGSGHPGGAWLSPAVAAFAAEYQVKVDATAGAFTTGTTGTWLDCSTTRSWSRDPGSVVTFTISFREKTTGIVRATLAGEELDAT